MSNDFQSDSRSSYRAKRKKTNIILNSLIVIVLALIVIVAYSIFSTGDEQASTENEPKTEEKQSANKETKENKESTADNEDETSIEEEESETAAAPEEADDSQAVVTEGDGTSNVVRTIENPSWKPVGTEQSGAHEPVYDDASVDWQEMLNAISYATDLDQSTMTVYWLGRDKSTSNASIGTVYSKATGEKYRVFIKWVDGEGWMPTKVEELAELER